MALTSDESYHNFLNTFMVFWLISGGTHAKCFEFCAFEMYYLTTRMPAPVSVFYFFFLTVCLRLYLTNTILDIKYNNSLEKIKIKS